MQLSVIIPVYNAHATLERCLESIVHQKGSFEIILINDGSKDDSIDICNRYADRYNFIRVIDKKNEGVCATRNLGIELAKGQWLMFIDQDDFIDDDTFSAIVPTESVDYDGVICPLIRHSRNNSIDYLGKITPGVFKPQSKEFGNAFREFGFLGMGAPWSRIYRTSIVKDPSIRFNPSITFCEDISFNYLFWNKACRIKMSDKPFYHYVNTFANTTAKFAGEQLIRNNLTLFKLENPFWSGEIGSAEALDYLKEHRAFTILFALYSIYRISNRMPRKERLHWMKRYYRFGEEHIPRQTSYYHAPLHKLLGLFLRNHQWLAADMLLNSVFSTERLIHRIKISKYHQIRP